MRRQPRSGRDGGMDLLGRCRCVAEGDENALPDQCADEFRNLIVMRRQRYLADQTATDALPFGDLVEIGCADMFTRMRATRSAGRRIGTQPFWKQLLKKMSPNEGAMKAR